MFPPQKSGRRFSALHAVITLVIVLATAALWRSGRESIPKLTSSTLPPEIATPAPAVPQTPAPPVPPRSPAAAQPPPNAAAAVATFAGFQRRPFAVTRSSGKHEWTAEDGRDPDAILGLAHNEPEVQRLMEENARIKRRQLVYRKETVPMLLDSARDSGQPLQSFTLPGLDGVEVEVEVTGTQLNQAANAGSVTGRIKGRSNSMVSVGFANGCESFNVLSPDDGLFLTADAREPGEVMVKEIDPDKYNPPAGDTPDFILTNQPPPRSKTK